MHEHLKNSLYAMRRDILSRRNDRPIVERCADPVDQWIANEGRERIAKDRDRDAKTLRDIEAALAAIVNGEYGVCGRCDGAIPVKRLEVLPFARWCVDCAEIEAMEVSQ